MASLEADCPDAPGRHGDTILDVGLANIRSEPPSGPDRMLDPLQDVVRIEDDSDRVGSDRLDQADELERGYFRPNVIDGMSFGVQEGITLALVDQPGSGKSTLARMLTGLPEPAEGAIFLGGQKIGSGLEARTKQEKQKIQLIHQSPAAL